MLDPAGIELLVADVGDEPELVRLAPGVDAILTCWNEVPASVLDVASTCKVVSTYGIGVDNIAVDRATELGILVTNVPDYCLDEVSDHAMALLLACARRIVPFAIESRQGLWQPGPAQGLHRLRGRRLGLIGFGAIARALVPKARGFGMEILAYTPRLTGNDLPDGVTATNDLDDLLSTSDFVSIHAPSTPATHHLINAAALSQMQSHAWLINTSRGALIDENALVEALTDNRIAGAALDVLTQEPADPTSPLLALPNVIVTPHVAFSSQDSVEELQRRAAEHVVYTLRGDPPPHIVNPEVLQRANCRL